jgi:ABC-type nitrate/sulfonate/bicarbonate transport system substrate-binding protein
MSDNRWYRRGAGLLLLAGSVLIADAGLTDASAACAAMRKINIGVSVAPPNVVHTTPYVAKELGLFEKHCIDATIIQFDGGGSAASKAAAAQGTALVSVQAIAVGNGVKVKQIWGLAPRLPQAYEVPGDVKTAKDLKGRRLSASGGGVGGLNWLMGREVLKTVGLTVDDVQFIAGGTAGRLPGLVSGQVDAVMLHPEDVYLAQQKKPDLHSLLNFAELLPNHMFNAYGASTDWIARERPLMVDAVAAMIEANRTIYRDRAKAVPIIMKATGKPKDAVEFAVDNLIKRCIWSVNDGFNTERTQWSIDNDVENGYIKPDKKPTVDQVADVALAKEAVEVAGGRVTIGNCTE